jgi:hypothetical protein
MLNLTIVTARKDDADRDYLLDGHAFIGSL